VDVLSFFRAAVGTQRVWRGLHFGHADPQDVERMHRDPVGYMRERGFGGNYHSGAGVHWTDDEDSAHNFAHDRDPEGYARDDAWDDEDDDSHSHGVVLHGHVEPHHVVQPGTEEHEGYQDFHAVLDHDHPEREVTVRQGSPVHISHVTATSVGPDGRARETTVPYGREHEA
jgi:hypothetical protein